MHGENDLYRHKEIRIEAWWSRFGQSRNVIDDDMAVPGYGRNSRIKDGWLYLCVVIDLFDRQVVGWSMRTDMTATVVIDAFMMAVVRKRPSGALVFHSDRGVQYCSMAFRAVSESALPQLIRSMSRKVNCWDNACAEFFFKTLKRELEERDGTSRPKIVRVAVFEYIEVYYNRIRIHTSNGATPPALVTRRVA
jgi:transposase InsO family protein